MTMAQNDKTPEALGAGTGGDEAGLFAGENSAAIWDDTGTRRLTGGGLGQNVWPPTDVLRDVVLRDGTTRTVAPGRYEAGETLVELREMFYGDQFPGGEPPYDPEAFDRLVRRPFRTSTWRNSRTCLAR